MDKNIQVRMNKAFDNYLKVTKCLQDDGHHVLNTDDGTDSYRRNFIRCITAVVEGYNNCLYEMARIGFEMRENQKFELSEKELKVLSDPRGSCAPDRIKRTLSALHKMLNLPKIDFGTEGWESTKKAIQKRDDLIHPKTAKNLEFADEPYDVLKEGLIWIYEQQCETVEIMIERAKAGTLGT